MCTKSIHNRVVLFVACSLVIAGTVYTRAAPKPKKSTRPPPRSTSKDTDTATTKSAETVRRVAAKQKGKIDVYFSPNGGCTKAIVKEIQGAKKEIRIQACTFTSQAITKAIIGARERGVKVTAILDESNKTSQYSTAGFLKKQGAEVVIDDKHVIAHNKIILIDGSVVITGSFDFSKAAEESNAENLLVIRGLPRVYAKYAYNFTKHYKHSVPYEGIAKEGGEPASDTPVEYQEPAATADIETNASPRAPPGEETDVTVYTTKSGKKYHKAGCHHLRGSRIPSKLSAAKASGYTPCSRCKPPE